ncbi:hypothetical protein M8J76_014302 [Diaphorina citri]|nr:hypothetical protein M8J75_004087 [Diaphorina citri]KAI5724024.1 hypothetical protein M8J76_014302 [Diaphorina citri]KAI5728689.1 hypothetical protein M8J77_019637 [Diaphorina citri]
MAPNRVALLWIVLCSSKTILGSQVILNPAVLPRIQIPGIPSVAYPANIPVHQIINGVPTITHTVVGVNPLTGQSILSPAIVPNPAVSVVPKTAITGTVGTQYFPTTDANNNQVLVSIPSGQYFLTTDANNNHVLVLVPSGTLPQVTVPSTYSSVGYINGVPLVPPSVTVVNMEAPKSDNSTSPNGTQKHS